MSKIEQKTANGSELVSQRYAKRSRFGEIMHSLKRNKGAMISLCFILLLVLVMIYSFIFIDFKDIMATNSAERLLRPSLQHPFGTDEMGRDLFIRVIYGTRYSLAIGVGAVAFALIVGVILGALAGFYGGIVETIIMRANDILSAIPGLLLGMVIVCVIGQSLPNLLLAVAITAIPGFVRITRASVLTVRGQEYIEAARSIGMSNLRIIFTQVIPNGLSPIIVNTTSMMGTVIIVAAQLSFLGFGIPVPTPEWGALVSLGRNVIRTAPYLTLFPGLFIMLTVLAFNIVGDGLRDALDPKLKR